MANGFLHFDVRGRMIFGSFWPRRRVPDSWISDGSGAVERLALLVSFGTWRSVPAFWRAVSWERLNLCLRTEFGAAPSASMRGYQEIPIVAVTGGPVWATEP